MSVDSHPVRLSDRDRQLLETLTLRVRVLSIEQAARTWWPKAVDPLKQTNKRMGHLERAGLVQIFTVMARPDLPMKDPLVVWQPGQRVPDLKRIAGVVAKRARREAVAIPVVMATESTGLTFGGRGGRRPRTSEQTHDLQLAAVYLAMRRDMPTRTRSWTHEDILVLEGHPSGQKLPDAVVTDGRSKTVIECCGESYGVAELEATHTYCDRHGYGYELW